MISDQPAGSAPARQEHHGQAVRLHRRRRRWRCRTSSGRTSPATSTLRPSGFQVREQPRSPTPRAARTVVQAVDPAGELEGRQGTSITIFVSGGGPRCRAWSASRQAEATAQLENDGFTGNTQSRDRHRRTASRRARCSRRAPSAGHGASRRASSVTIFVGQAASHRRRHVPAAARPRPPTPRAHQPSPSAITRARERSASGDDRAQVPRQKQGGLHAAAEVNQGEGQPPLAGAHHAGLPAARAGLDRAVLRHRRQTTPLQSALGSWNLVLGFGFIIAGVALSTKWR